MWRELICGWRGPIFPRFSFLNHRQHAPGCNHCGVASPRIHRIWRWKSVKALYLSLCVNQVSLLPIHPCGRIERAGITIFQTCNAITDSTDSPAFSSPSATCISSPVIRLVLHVPSWRIQSQGIDRTGKFALEPRRLVSAWGAALEAWLRLLADREFRWSGGYQEISSM